MDEKYFKELSDSINELKEKLDFGALGRLRGPVADPVPDIYFPGQRHIDPLRIRGPIADPVPWELLDKSKIANLRIQQLDNAINDLKNNIKFLEKERAFLKESYKQ